MRYRFIEEHRQTYAVGRLCLMLGIKLSSYYAWKKRSPSPRIQADRATIDHIRRIYKMSRKAYGSPD